MDYTKTDFQATKVKTKYEYFYHVINSHTSFSYDIEKKTLYCIIEGDLNKEIEGEMSFEEFKHRCNAAMKYNLKMSMRMN